MRGLIRGAKIAGFTAAMALMMNASAYAGGLYEPSMKDEPAPARRCSTSANVALTTDYVFRGISQTDESAAIQGGFDLTCGRFYAGLWASNLDFGGDQTQTGQGIDFADIEIDYYAGIKSTIPNTSIEIDLGVTYYSYPNAFDDRTYTNAAAAVVVLQETDFWEFKVGASATLVPDVLTAVLVSNCTTD